MQDRLIFVISPPRAGSTLLQHMLGSHSQILTYPEPHLITPLAFLGYYDLVDKAPYDHINAAEAIKLFVQGLPRGEADYLDAVRAYTDTLYGRMLSISDKRYFMDKTPGYALVLPFLTKLYPDARYVVLTRHPLAIASSYANSFFDGDWMAAHSFNPVVNRYVPAIADMLRTPPRHMLQVSYENLVQNPHRELEAVCAFLALDFQPSMVDYGEHYQAPRAGRGDPISVRRETRPVATSVDKWAGELAGDPDKRALAEDIVASLDPSDVELWGFEHAALLPHLNTEPGATTKPTKLKTNSFILQRRIMLALKKDIRQRPHGKLVERLRYYCNVLLRE
ncbi:MAG TPA: sulfotransferase [Polyangiales bacterium]|nr:sulfotransferase [Polyangiales bacterium]